MTESERQSRIRQNWQSVATEVATAAVESGRTPEQVRIVGVTKYVDAETTSMLVHAGCGSLGENRPQVLWQKAESDELCNHSIDWHMIGHVQRNKLRRMMRYRPMIHSVDSERLLKAIGEEADNSGTPVSVLLEINISGDASKTGLEPDALRRLLLQERPPGIQIDGLMAMAGWGTESDEAQKQFAQVRELRDQLAAETDLPLKELSMGMSSDFAEAIAEGATLVRIGSRLFDGVIRR